MVIITDKNNICKAGKWSGVKGEQIMYFQASFICLEWKCLFLKLLKTGKLIWNKIFNLFHASAKVSGNIIFVVYSNLISGDRLQTHKKGLIGDRDFKKNNLKDSRVQLNAFCKKIHKNAQCSSQKNGRSYRNATRMPHEQSTSIKVLVKCQRDKTRLSKNA